MTKKTKAVLKTYFERGDRPTQGEFESLIDSTLQDLKVTAGGLEISGTPDSDTEVTIPLNDLNFWQEDSNGDIAFPTNNISLNNSLVKVNKILDAQTGSSSTSLLTEKAIVEYVNARTTSVLVSAYRTTNFSMVSNNMSTQRKFPMTTESTGNGYYSTDIFTANTGGTYEIAFNTKLQSLSPAISSYFVELRLIVQRGTSNIVDNRIYRLPASQDLVLNESNKNSNQFTFIGAESSKFLLVSYDYSSNPLQIGYTKSVAMQAGDKAFVRLTASGCNAVFTGGASNTNLTIKSV